MAKKHSNANRQKRQKKAAAKKNAATAATAAPVPATTKEETVIVEQLPDVTIEEQQPSENASKTTLIQEEIKEKEAPAADGEPPVAVAESKEDKEVVNAQQPVASDVPEDKKNEVGEALAAESEVPKTEQAVNPVSTPLENVAVAEEQVPVEDVTDGEPVSDETKDTSTMVEQVKPKNTEESVTAEPAAPATGVEPVKSPLSGKPDEFASPGPVAEENKEPTCSQEHVTDSTNDEIVSPSDKVQEKEANDPENPEPGNRGSPDAPVTAETNGSASDVETSTATKEIVTKEIEKPALAKEIVNEIKVPAVEKKDLKPAKRTVATREIKCSEEKPKKKILGLFGKKAKDQKSKAAVASDEKQKVKRKAWQFWKSS